MEVLFEDNHIIAINKRVSDIVQGDQTGDIPLSELVKDYLKIKYQKPGNVFVGVPHRLDRPTSGLVLFAKTSKALTRLNEMFREKDSMTKIYWAVVDRKPPLSEGILTHWLVRNTTQNKSYAYDAPRGDAKRSELKYRFIMSSAKFHLLEIELITGRHHQIRAQLAAIGCHIKGDLKYGFPRSNADGGIHLHARQISFMHPVSKEPITIVAPTPDENLWKTLEVRVEMNQFQ
jgi:23S rRNA pseudouridine1911/1915/1917 synthase